MRDRAAFPVLAGDRAGHDRDGVRPEACIRPVRPGQDLIVLLPDSGPNRPGGARVSNQIRRRRPCRRTLMRQWWPRIAGPFSPMLSAGHAEIFGDALSPCRRPASVHVYFRFESDSLTDQSQALIPEFGAVKGMRSRTSRSSGTPTHGIPMTNYGFGLKRAMMFEISW